MASARIGFDGERLRFFVTIDVDPQKPLRTEGEWGSRDGLELAFSDTGDDAPIFLLHAYPDGSIEVTGADSAAAEHCQALQKHCCMAHCSEL